MELPKTKLSNGLVVGNFNSTHSYTFEDGGILPAVDEETFEKRKFKTDSNITYHNTSFRDVKTEDSLSLEVMTDLVHCAGSVDVLIVSRRMRTAALRQAIESELELLQSVLVNNIRCIHVVSWVPPICSIDTFAI